VEGMDLIDGVKNDLSSSKEILIYRKSTFE
jgi:hypothetical protein